jgi:hypothetical protein
MVSIADTNKLGVDCQQQEYGRRPPRVPRYLNGQSAGVSRVSGLGRHLAHVAIRRDDMSLLLILIILLVLFGGGGLYLGGPRTGISLGGLILIVIVIMAVTGRL